MNDNPILDELYTEELYYLPVRNRIVLSKSWNELTAEEIGQLTKITDALRDRINAKYKLDAFEVQHSRSPDFGRLAEGTGKLIYFGTPQEGITPYEVFTRGSARMVLSESLEALLANADARTKLWVALRVLFAE